jgi:hypothetical protein
MAAYHRNNRIRGNKADQKCKDFVEKVKAARAKADKTHRDNKELRLLALSMNVWECRVNLALRNS